MILFILGIAMSGWGIFQRSKPLAFEGYDSLKSGMSALKSQDLASANLPAPISVVLPVSDEMHCSDCHTNGKAANRATTPSKIRVRLPRTGGLSRW